MGVVSYGALSPATCGSFRPKALGVVCDVRLSDRAPNGLGVVSDPVLSMGDRAAKGLGLGWYSGLAAVCLANGLASAGPSMELCAYVGSSSPYSSARQSVGVLSGTRLLDRASNSLAGLPSELLGVVTFGANGLAMLLLGIPRPLVTPAALDRVSVFAFEDGVGRKALAAGADDSVNGFAPGFVDARLEASASCVARAKNGFCFDGDSISGSIA